MDGPNCLRPHYRTTISSLLRNEHFTAFSNHEHHIRLALIGSSHILYLVRFGKADGSMAKVYADVNQHMPKSYWEYDSVNITWGVLENYEVVRKIGD